MNFAPIIIFAFNRPDALKATVESLKKNPESKDSELYIFIDGPRNEEDETKVEEVNSYVSSISGFKSLNVKSSSKNKGLGKSIISGVTEVINRHGSAIVIEDDLILLPNFLNFVNKGLSQYLNKQEVFSICGYTNKVSIPNDYDYDAYFCTRSSSWGWATWKDRWNSIDWKLNAWEDVCKRRKDFNRWGGSDCFGMLEGWKNGLNKSWAIRFCFNQFMQNKLSLFPVKSLVINDGFDGAGTNCKKWSRFKFELMDSNHIDFRLPSEITINKSFIRSTLKYHSIPRRILSRLMYLIYR